MMYLETTCHVSHVMNHMSRVMCHMSLFNLSETVRARDLQFSHDINITQCVMCPVSHVRYHMSLAIFFLYEALFIFNFSLKPAVCYVPYSFQ